MPLLDSFFNWLFGTSSTATTSPAEESDNTLADKIKSLTQYKGNLYNAFTRDLSDFEKNFLLVASGLLAFSITFLKDIIKVNDTVCLGLLFGGWGALALSIGLILYSFIRSAYGSDDIRNSIDGYLTRIEKLDHEETLTLDEIVALRKELRPRVNKIKSHLMCVRILAMSFFMVGLGLFGCFLFQNMEKSQQEAAMAKKETTAKSRAIRKLKVEGLTIDITDSTLIIEK